MIGPHDPAMRPEDLPERYIAVPSVPMHNHPGLYIPLPLDNVLTQARDWDFDVVLGQTNTELMELGLWLRRAKGTPLVCVNTVHLPSVYPVVMPDALHHNETAHRLFQNTFLRLAEGTSVDVYNQSDGLVVLCKGLERYWRDRGVKSPIHVVPRNVEPDVHKIDNVYVYNIDDLEKQVAESAVRGGHPWFSAKWGKEVLCRVIGPAPGAIER